MEIGISLDAKENSIQLLLDKEKKAEIDKEKVQTPVAKKNELESMMKRKNFKDKLV